MGLKQATGYAGGHDSTNANSSWFYYPSGNPWPDTTGWVKWLNSDNYIENSNLLLIGDALMPLSIQYTGALYRLYWNTLNPIDLIADAWTDSNITLSWTPPKDITSLQGYKICWGIVSGSCQYSDTILSNTLVSYGRGDFQNGTTYYFGVMPIYKTGYEGGATKEVSATPVAGDGVLVVTPSDNLMSSGKQSGPFSPTSIVYTVKNTGGSLINWTVSKGKSWVDLSSLGGTLGKGASASLTVTINSGANSLGAGNYSDTITFTNTTNGTGNTTRIVNLGIGTTAAGRLRVTPDSGLSSTGNQGNSGSFNPLWLNYTLTNTQGGAMTWEATTTSLWAYLSTGTDRNYKTGTLNSLGSNGVLKVMIDDVYAATLAPGTYTDTVTIKNVTDNIIQKRTVSLIVTPSPGVLSVSAGSLASTGYQGGPFNPSNVQLILTNTGGNTLSWAASKAQGWVSLYSTAGSLAPNASTTLSVSVNGSANSLAPGSYSDSVILTNTDNNLGDTTIPVGLTVIVVPGVLSVGPLYGLASIGTQGGPFSPSSVTYTYTLQNNGGTSINWAASNVQTWVTLSPTSGTLAAGASTRVTTSIGLGANSLSPETYNDTVTFTNTTNGNGNTTWPVNLTVNAPSITGACGSSNGGTFTTAPTTNLCSAGNATTVSGSGPWTWSCNGTNGGTNASCSANIQTYLLTVSSTNPTSGVAITVSRNDNSSLGHGTTQFTRTYNNGTTVTLTAPSASGSNTFSSWTGCNSTGGYQCTVTMDTAKTVTANYTIPTRVLTVASTNPASGVAITVSPKDNSSLGNGTTQFTRTYNNGASVTLTASTASGGNNFSSWTGCNSTSGYQCTVTMDAAKTVTANYVTPTLTNTLTVASTNPASGVGVTVSPNDNSGAGNGTTQFMRTYNNGTQVTLTAPATAGGNSFSSWSGCTGTSGMTCSVTMDAAKTVTANYTTPTRVLTVASTNPASGVAITVNPNDNSVSGNGSTQFTRTYNNGTTVTLSAPSASGSNTFSSWTGCNGTSGYQCTVTMDAAKTVTANYTIPTRILTVASTNPTSGVAITISSNDNSGTGNGTTQFTRTYNNSTTVTLIAPSTSGGNSFSAWTGCDSAAGTQCIVQMTASKTVTATFSTPPTSTAGEIVFASNRDAKWQIYKMNSDGIGPTNITNDLYDNVQPCVSPDGTQIVFKSNRTSQYCSTGFCDLYLINIDGTGLTLITNASARNVYNVGPCLWSQDGTKIYFGGRSASSGGYQELWVVNNNGTNQHPVLSQSGRDFSPFSLSADGTQISLEDIKGYWDGSDNVQSTVNTDGTGYSKSALAAGPRDDFGRWSPDGSKFVYMKGRGSGSTAQIYVESRTGSDYPGTNISNDAIESGYPYWSPDSAKIVYSTITGTYSHMWTMNADGTGNTQITTGNQSDSWPVWSPPVSVNGVCSLSHNGTFTTAPTMDLCSAGNNTSVSGTGPWTWSCTGLNGGITVSCSANIQVWTVTASAGIGGTISPASRIVNHGPTTTFTVTPSSGYSVTMGGTCGGNPASGTSQFTYTTNPITANCTVTATFTLSTMPAHSGDLDGDGVVAVNDALRTLLIASGLTNNVTPQELVCIDVAPLENGKPKGDGKIDIGDVILILRKAVDPTLW